MKNALKVALGATIVYILINCYSNRYNVKERDIENRLATTPITRTISGIEYKINDFMMTQITKDADNEASFGVMADCHGYYKNAKEFAELFKNQEVNGIVILGDSAQQFRQKSDPRLTSNEEIFKCVEAAAVTGLPVYVIPGNHDTRTDYAKAMQDLQKKYSNVFDLSTIRVVDGDDFDFVSNPFGTDFTYDGSDNFKGSKQDIIAISNYVKLLTDNDAKILLTHQPPRCKGKNGIDVTYDGRNVGDKTLDRVVRENNLNVFLAHIHEAGGRSNGAGGIGNWHSKPSEQIRLNPGAVCPWNYIDSSSRDGTTFYAGMAALVYIKGKELTYHTFTLREGELMERMR